MFNWKHSLDFGRVKGTDLLLFSLFLTFLFRREDTVEKAADYNFCKLILKEIFHIKMRKIVKKPPDYVR